jgi:hypothetical protein
VPLDNCPVTQGSDRPGPLPADLPVGPTEHWYGIEPLWVDLSLVQPADDQPVPPDGRTYRVRWKAFIDGELSANVTRLDSSGEGRAEVFPALAGGHAFWTGEVWLPSAGCWLVTATVGEVSLGFVMRSGGAPRRRLTISGRAGGSGRARRPRTPATPGPGGTRARR